MPIILSFSSWLFKWSKWSYRSCYGCGILLSSVSGASWCTGGIIIIPNIWCRYVLLLFALQPAVLIMSSRHYPCRSHFGQSLLCYSLIFAAYVVMISICWVFLLWYPPLRFAIFCIICAVFTGSMYVLFLVFLCSVSVGCGSILFAGVLIFYPYHSLHVLLAVRGVISRPHNGCLIREQHII
jgi:hypothetical protein